MADGQVGYVLRYIRRLAGLACRAGDWSDGQLLQRFATQHDEAAFEALLQRHGALVLGVCRRVLRDSHAAEDAFQATFLVLARKAASIRKQESIGTWLYGVAYRLAVRTKADAARRRAYEKRVEPMPTPDPMADIVRGDLRRVLDEELGRLPEKYRAPLVLCYLQGKTNQQAARELGWPTGTMSRRLARGRELLRERLTGRGVTLSTALLVTAFAEEASAVTVSAGLIHSTLETSLLFVVGQTAVAGMISGQAVALAEAVLKAMWMTKLKIAAAVLTLSSVAAGAGILAHSALAGRPSVARLEDPQRKKPARNEPPPAVETNADPQGLSLFGTVVDAAGKPVRGASVFLREGPTSWRRDISPTLRNWHALETRSLASLISDEQGRFTFTDLILGKPEPLRKRVCPLDIIVMAKGHGLAWRHLPDGQSSSRLTLPPEAKIEGLLVDPRGNPIAGARVQVIDIAGLHQVARPSMASAEYIDLQYAQVPVETKTGADGRFVLAGLPQNIRATLRCSAERFLPQEVYVATTDKPQPKTVADSNSGPRDRITQEIVHTGMLALHLQPGHRLHGRAVFEDTGQPAAGADVTFLISPPQHTADAHGEFFLNELPPGKFNFSVSPPKKTDYLGVQTEVEIPADKWEIEYTTRLPRGAVVSGRVADEETATGIPGVPIQYWPTPEQAKRLPYPWTTRSEADGTFRFAVPPGKGRLVIVGAVPGYVTYDQSGSLSDVDHRWVREIDAKMSHPVAGVQFTLSRGRVVTGRVLDIEGKPAKAEVASRHIFASNSHLDLSWFTDAEGKFTLSGLKSDQVYELVFTSRQRKLAAKVLVPAPEGKNMIHAVEVKLRPMVAVVGRVLDENQKPIPGATAKLRQWQGDYGEVGGDFALADGAGKFTLDTLVPEARYSVDITAEGYTSNYSPQFVAQLGRTNPLGDFELLKADQVLAGVLVDPTGKPLAGVAVQGSPMGRMLQVWSEKQVTDLQGKFRLTGLPRGQVELRVWIPWVKGSLNGGRFRTDSEKTRIVLPVPPD